MSRRRNVLQTPAVTSVEFHARFGLAAKMITRHTLALIDVHTAECCASLEQGGGLARLNVYRSGGECVSEWRFM